MNNKYPGILLNEDALVYIKYLIMKIIKILLSPYASDHSSTSPLTTSTGAVITSSTALTNGPAFVPLLSSSRSSSNVLIRLSDLEERVNLTFPWELEQAIIEAAENILTDLNDLTVNRAGSLENSSGTFRAKLSKLCRKPPSKQQKMNKIYVNVKIPFMAFSHFLRELLGGGKDVKYDPDPEAIVFMLVVIECIVSEILQSSGKFVYNITKSKETKERKVTKEDVKISMDGGNVVSMISMIKSLFKPDDEVNFDDPDANSCLQSDPGSTLQSSTLCFFSLDLDPKFISKLIENKENEKLLRQQKLLEHQLPSALVGNLSLNPDASGTFDHLSSSSTQSSSTNVKRHTHRSSRLFSKQNVTYEDVVKELISEEKFFIRDLQLIIKLFRESFLELMKQQETDSSSLPSSPTSPTSPSLTSSCLSTVGLLNDQSSFPSSPIHKSFGTRIKASDINAIFSNISDIEELSVKLLCSLEDTLEALISSNLSNEDVSKSGSGNVSGSNSGSVSSMSKSVIESIGSVFHDIAEDQEFDVYEVFASDIIGNHALLRQGLDSKCDCTGYDWSTSPSNKVLQDLLADSMISKPFQTAGKGFFQQIKYILPKLLIRIVYHCQTYFNYIPILKSLSPSEEDKDYFTTAEGILKFLVSNLDRMTGLTFKSRPMAIPVLFGQNFFSLHLPGSASATTSPSSSNTGTMTLNPANGFTSPSMSSTVTSCGPLISYTISHNSVNTTHRVLHLVSQIDGFDSLPHQHFNYLLLENTKFGRIYKSSTSSKSRSERKAFLFDGALLLCKDAQPSKKCLYGNTKRYLISDIEVIDLPDPPGVHSSASFSVASSARDPCCTTGVINPSLPGQNLNEDQLGELSSQSSMSLRSPWGTSTTSLVSTTSNSFIQGSGIGSTLTLKPDYVPRFKNAFGIVVRESKEFIILSTDTVEYKNLWISNLIFLTSKSSLEKNLETILNEEDRKNPLQVPSPSVYQFSVPDSDSNIIFEENKFNNAGAPLIKAATMAKLIERLTFHLHADPTFVHVFLTTYRSFSNPRELLTYLIERFNVPDIDSKVREDVKKFEKDYVKPVQLRVLNVIRHWVDQHYYDFSNDEELLEDLIIFLDKKAGKQKALKKWVDSILKNIYRNKENSYKNNQAADMSAIFNSSPPHFEWHVITAENVSSAPPEMFNLLTIHPIEFARQFTLLEYELFKKVKPSELVDCAWTKKDKERTSPNLLRFTNCGNNYTYWLEQQILETENFEERVAVYSRILEILQVFQELNNFDGIICTVAALTSASVHRLEHTKKGIPKVLEKSFEEAEKLNRGHHKNYFDLLRLINPPCVPFLGKYLTYIVQIHEGNSDETRISVRDELRSYAIGESPSLQGTSTHTLINFSKRRKIAEITQEIKQYQNTPYCLNQERHIRAFLESIKPLESPNFVQYVKNKRDVGNNSIPDVGSMDKDEKAKHFGDYLHELSLDIEPRKGSDGIKKPYKVGERRWPNLSLKSPGIKPSPPPVVASTVTTNSGPSSNALSNTLSRARGVFASAVATSGLSLSNNKGQNSGSSQPINNLNDSSDAAQISLRP